MRDRTPEEIAALEAAARSWVGTPFCEGSAVKGAGVCCHRLPAAVYQEAGWWPAVEVPAGPRAWARAQSRSLIAEWIDESGRFESLPVGAEARPGDLFGYRVGRTVHHLALVLGGGRLLHVGEGHGTVIVDAMPPVWARRCERHWRPLP